jgi:acyl-CoA hydrolase
MNWQFEYEQKVKTADEAVKLVESGEKVYVGTCSSVSYELMRALWKRREEIEDVEILSSNVTKPCPIFDEKENNPFSFSSFFIGPGERRAMDNGHKVNFTSVHLSQVDLWAKETAKPDVCFFDVSEPDENGNMCYGPSGVCLDIDFKEKAKKIIVQANKQIPYIYGQDNLIHISEVDAVVKVDEVAATIGNPEIDDVTKTLSDIIVEHVPDGATIQLGLGSL